MVCFRALYLNFIMLITFRVLLLISFFIIISNQLQVDYNGFNLRISWPPFPRHFHGVRKEVEEEAVILVSVRTSFSFKIQGRKP